MTSLKLEGDLSEIDEVQQNFILKVIEDLGYKDNKVRVEPVGKAGNNFVANVKRIIIEKENEKPLKFVVKIAPQNEIAREITNTAIMFQNETAIYNDMFPKFSQLEKQFNVPQEERFIYPVCFGALKTEPHEVLILEDMTVHGYDTKDKMVPLDIETVKLVLKSFAQMHSLSYALKKENPEAYTSIKESLGNMWEALVQKNNYEPMFKPAEDQVIEMLGSDIAKEKCKGLFVNLPVQEVSIRKSESNAKETVIAQGDSWTNNFLFKTEEGTAISCVMIDYQMSRASSPASDLLYMIFCCTDYETRKQHFYDWLDYYYSELEKALSKFGLDISSELPRDIFDEKIKKHGKSSVPMSIMTALITMREESEAPDFKKDVGSNTFDGMAEHMDVNRLKPETKARIIGRVQGSFASAMEFGLL